MLELFRYIEQSFVEPTRDNKFINVENNSEFQNKLRDERNQNGAAERMREEANQYLNANFADSPQGSIYFGKQLLEFHNEIQHLDSTAEENIYHFVERIFDQSVQNLVESDSFRADKEFLDNSIVAVKLVTAFDRVDSSALVAMRQAIALIEDVVQSHMAEADPEKLKRLLLRPIRVPKSLLPPQAARTTTPPSDGDQDPEHQRIEALQREVNSLKTTYQTLMSVYPEDLEITPIQDRTASKLASNVESTSEQNDSSELGSASERTVLALSPSLLSRLPDDVQHTLDSVGVNVATTDLTNLVSRVKDRWLAATQELQPYITPAPAKIYQLGIHTFAVQPLAKIATPPLTMPDFSHAVTRPVGIGNLQVVRQELIGYEAGEISRIENILEGELFRRETIRTESTDITVIQEKETIQTDERDLQSTERNELASEAQKEVSKQTVSTQGQSTSTDYGKLVENSKTNYARSVTDRAVNSLTQRVKEQRIMREQRSYTEKIVHEFDNRNGASKVRGIYQWVDKKFKTRIMNYGKRLLYDVVVPEPAAFLIESLEKSQQPEAFKLTKPTAPSIKYQIIIAGPLGANTSARYRDLLPEDLNLSNYMYYAKQYGVTGAIEPPPDEFVQTVAHTDTPQEVSKEINHRGNKDFTDYFSAFKILIPPGYKAVSGYIQFVNPNNVNNDRRYEFFIGEKYFFHFRKQPENLWEFSYFNHSFIMDNETGEIPVTVRSFPGIYQFNYAIGINCKRIDKVYERWQLKTFAAITEGYRRQLAEYEDKLAQRQVALRTLMALKQNYSHNPSIERTELKKAFIHLLMSEHFAKVNYPTPNPNQFSTDPTYVKKWGAVVAFFERAFEWENIIYNYYPYFWGQKSRWGELVLIQDLDPQFEEFLKAGAARIVVPVRPGFEGALAHYQETGDIWMGEEIPDMYSDFYVSIIDEIRSRNYAPDEEICVAEWEVKLPTTLVMLKEDAALPAGKNEVKPEPIDQ
jgi:hypothetical protein